MHAFPAVGFIELLLLLLMGGGSGGLPLGLPPGEQDAALPRTVPDSCIVYVDWAARSAGRLDGAGMDGLVADPEVKAFVQQVDHALRTAFERNISNEQERAVALAGVDLAETLLQRPGCLFISFSADDLPPREDFPNFAPVFERLKVGLVLTTVDDSDAIQAALTTLFAAGRIELPETLDRFLLPLPVPGGGITLHRAGERFVLCYGQGTLDTILAGLAGERQGWLDDQRLTAAMQAVAVERPAQRGWIDVRNLLLIVDRLAGNRAMVAETVGPLGLNGVDHLASTTGVDPQTGQVVSRTHFPVGEHRDGLLALAAGRPLTAADFAHVPADADFLVAQSLNPPQILDAVRKIVQAANPELGEQFDAGLSQAEGVLELSVRDDVMAAFGDVWTLYDAPSNGGVLASAPVLCLEVRDHERASRCFLRLMELIEANLPGDQFPDPRRSHGAFLASHEFEVGGETHAIAFINIVGEDDVVVAPTFCLTESHLLFALQPQPLKAHLRFQAETAARKPLEFAADHPLRTRSLIHWSRVDTAAAMRYVVAASPYVGQMLASEVQGQRTEIDLFALPSARGLLPYLSESTGWIEVDPTGVTWGATNGVPIPGVGGGLSTLPLMWFGIRAQAAPVMIR